MQTTAMLLVRSSSTPVLECLLARPAHHPELAPDAKIEFCSAGESAHAPMSVSLSTPRATTHLPPTCQSHMHLDSPFRPSRSESPHSELPSSNGIRKVLSENDLSSLGAGGGSLMPAKIAANTLLQHPLVEDCIPCSGFDSHNSSPYLPLGKKGRALLPALSRRRSLGSLPSELPSVFLSGDSTGWDFAILEEVELTPSCSSAGCETDEEREADAGIFDKIALPVGRSGDMKKDVDVVIGSYGEVQSVDGMPQRVIMQEMGNRQREASTGPPQADMAASSSGRWSEPVGTFEQSLSMYSVSRNGSASAGSALAEEVCEPSLTLRHVYHGEDNLEVGCNGGDGGRGARPPITGGGGGGGDAGGLGRGGHDVADQHYQHVLQKDPGNPLLLRNYAQYLAEVKHDFRKAEEFFERAILASPTDGELLGQYAKMLWEVKHDIERAAMYFERAVQAAPDNSYVMAAYASFLWSSEEEGQQSRGSGSSDIFGSFPSLVSAGLA